MDPAAHWDAIYKNKSPDALSWYRPHLDKSLALIERAAANRSVSIIDIGGGEATLVDDLLARGYQDISVLDISPTAVAATRRRLGPREWRVTWRVADLMQAELPWQHFDVWHDRAVFHFLTTPDQRAAYVRQLVHAVKPGGHVIVATFGPEGPARCSGLEVVRYDAGTLQGQLGEPFRLMESDTEMHRTPLGVSQQFLYCHFRRG
jgi:SAM-dependent methyltransferase